MYNHLTLWTHEGPGPGTAGLSDVSRPPKQLGGIAPQHVPPDLAVEELALLPGLHQARPHQLSWDVVDYIAIPRRGETIDWNLT